MIRFGLPTPLKISIDWPWLSTIASGKLSISHVRAVSPRPVVRKIAWSSSVSTATLCADRLAEAARDGVPVDRDFARDGADLGLAAVFAAVDREPGAIRPAVAHLAHHQAGQPAEIGVQRLVLEKKPGNSAHSSLPRVPEQCADGLRTCQFPVKILSSEESRQTDCCETMIDR